MNISKHQEVKIQPIIKLGQVKPGQVIRLATTSLDEAFADSLFWIRVDAPEVKADRVRLVDPVTGKQIELDSIHHVVIHNATLNISPE